MSLGLRIPDDVSLLIYGDPEWASIFYPKCTCMRRPVREMGRRGMRILCDRMNGIHAERSQDITLCSELITRESVKVL
jgi:LacI family transcriptional regulator